MERQALFLTWQGSTTMDSAWSSPEISALQTRSVRSSEAARLPTPLEPYIDTFRNKKTCNRTCSSWPYLHCFLLWPLVHKVCVVLQNVGVVNQHPCVDGRPLLCFVEDHHEFVDLLGNRGVIRSRELLAALQAVCVVLELVRAQVIDLVKAVRQERGLGKELRPALQKHQNVVRTCATSIQASKHPSIQASMLSESCETCPLPPETTYPLAVARQFARIVVDDETWGPMLEAGDEKREYVPQRLVAEKHVIVEYKPMLACDDHDPVRLVLLGLGRFLHQ
jgi:hypothetical protein